MLGLESLVGSRPQKALSARFRLGHRKPWESFEVCVCVGGVGMTWLGLSLGKTMVKSLIMEF